MVSVVNSSTTSRTKITERVGLFTSDLKFSKISQMKNSPATTTASAYDSTGSLITGKKPAPSSIPCLLDELTFKLFSDFPVPIHLLVC